VIAVDHHRLAHFFLSAVNLNEPTEYKRPCR
jgi:hypothetical protein